MSAKFRFSLKTDIGKKRLQNQDQCIALPQLSFFMVYDGMEGHHGEALASATSVKVMIDSLKKAQQKKNTSPLQALSQAIQAANEAIFHQSIENPRLQGMGTTATALFFQD